MATMNSERKGRENKTGDEIRYAERGCEKVSKTVTGIKWQTLQQRTAAGTEDVRNRDMRHSEEGPESPGRKGALSQKDGGASSSGRTVGASPDGRGRCTARNREVRL